MSLLPGMEDDMGGKRPRGKMTPYACFVKVIRAEHKKKHPLESIVFSEFSKKCAEKWRQMTEKEKKRFQEMSEKDKERFNKEMSYYSASGNMGQMNMGQGGKMGGKGSRKRKRPKDPNAPKRALSAFMWFCKAERPNVKGANPQLKMGQIAKVLSEQWKVCQNKHVYEGQADTDKERYREAMVEWKKIAPPPQKRTYNDGMFGAHDSRYHHQKVPRDPDLPKRPLSGFMWFCKAERPAVRDANPELKVGQIAQILSEHWKACVDKTRFEEEANVDKARYREQINAYKATHPNRPKQQHHPHHYNDLAFDMAHGPHRGHSSKPPRDPDLPKRPLSAFMWFQKAQRSAVSVTNPDLKVGQIAQILSEQWKVCLNKEQYEELANADKRRYAEEMKVYKAKKGEVHHVRPSPSQPPPSAAVGMMQPSPQALVHAQGHLPMPPKRSRPDEHSSSGSDSSGSESDSDEDDDDEESD